jgi:hypothetical protein
MLANLQFLGRMDSRKNGPWNGFRAGKPDETGPCAGSVRGRDLLPALRRPGSDHAPPVVRRRDADLRQRPLFRRVPVGRRDHQLPQASVSGRLSSGTEVERKPEQSKTRVAYPEAAAPRQWPCVLAIHVTQQGARGPAFGTWVMMNSYARSSRQKGMSSSEISAE